MSEEIILKVENLHTSFNNGGKLVDIVKDVSFEVYKGKTLAIVGESGCGKSVTVHSVMNLLPKAGKITQGSVTYYADGKEYRLNELPQYGKQMREIRGRHIGMIFQDPMSSLNPVYRVGSQIIENLMQHNKGMNKKEALEEAVYMLARLGIPDPRNRIRDYPHQFSGGMKQRVMIAIAMVCNPDILIADEPTTALDVTIQAQIMDLMKEIQEKENKSIILITHNMGLVAENADYAAVMYMGRIVEYAPVEQIFNLPSHPYTKALLRSVPVPGMDKNKKLETIEGQTPDPKDCKDGCEFANRCPHAMEKCYKGNVKNYEVEAGHHVRCHLFEGCKEV